MHLYKNGQLLESFKNMFFTGQEIHNYNTRNKTFFRLPSCRTNVRKFSLPFQGPKIFNSVNDEIKNSLKLRSPVHHYNSVCFSFAVRTIAADARRLGQAQCCLSVAKGNKNKELPFEEIAKGKYERVCVYTPLKQT